MNLHVLRSLSAVIKECQDFPFSTRNVKQYLFEIDAPDTVEIILILQMYTIPIYSCQ